MKRFKLSFCKGNTIQNEWWIQNSCTYTEVHYLLKHKFGRKDMFLSVGCSSYYLIKWIVHECSLKLVSKRIAIRFYTFYATFETIFFKTWIPKLSVRTSRILRVFHKNQSISSIRINLLLASYYKHCTYKCFRPVF